MPRYYFRFSTGGDDADADTEGTELATADDARREAARVLIEMARDWQASGYPQGSVLVTDAVGGRVFRLQLGFDEVTD